MYEIMASIPDCFKKIVLFISSYIPLFIFLIIISLDFNKNISKQLLQYEYLFMIFFILVIFGLSIKIICYPKYISTFDVQGSYYESIEKTGDNVISYLMTYIMPLISTVQNGNLDVNNLTINLILFFIIGRVYIKQDLVYLNPLLSFMGVNIYKTKTEEHYILSKLSIINIRSCENDETNNYSLILYRITDTTSYLKRKKK